jgi:hypothetical protein
LLFDSRAGKPNWDRRPIVRRSEPELVGNATLCSLGQSRSSLCTPLYVPHACHYINSVQGQNGQRESNHRNSALCPPISVKTVHAIAAADSVPDPNPNRSHLISAAVDLPLQRKLSGQRTKRTMQNSKAFLWPLVTTIVIISCPLYFPG